VDSPDGRVVRFVDRCIAVGYYDNSAGQQVTLAERWDGTGWSVQPTPNPTGGGPVSVNGASLAGVSCTSPAACLAVGSYAYNFGKEGTLVERWDGTSRSILPGSANGGLSGVSCTSATTCTAIGGHCGCWPDTPLVERWDGASWSTEPTPNPAGARSNLLFAISCVSPTVCTAVGSYDRPHVFGVPMVEHWDGTSWSVQPSTNPAGATSSYLYGVSCASPTACTAVGRYTNAAGVQVTLSQAGMALAGRSCRHPTRWARAAAI
jgi:hypothetical protein